MINLALRSLRDLIFNPVFEHHYRVAVKLLAILLIFPLRRMGLSLFYSYLQLRLWFFVIQ
jgi:hypothetical protein